MAFSNFAFKNVINNNTNREKKRINIYLCQVYLF